MTTRTYLSIGDVLTLLREEFPDVTISKIRFLESQGLVNPERSPSGYRKFFEHDVERLRWVLRQQREHFLPLKVIRDRLADGDLDDAGPDVGNGKPSEHASVAAGDAGAGHWSTEQPTKADQEAMARILEDASRRAARLPDDAQARRGLQVVAGGDTAAPPAPAPMERDREGTGSAAPPARTPAAQAAPSARADGPRAAGAPRGADDERKRTAPTGPHSHRGRKRQRRRPGPDDRRRRRKRARARPRPPRRLQPAGRRPRPAW